MWLFETMWLLQFINIHHLSFKCFNLLHSVMCVCVCVYVYCTCMHVCGLEIQGRWTHNEYRESHTKQSHLPLLSQCFLNAFSMPSQNSVQSSSKTLSHAWMRHRLKVPATWACLVQLAPLGFNHCRGGARTQPLCWGNPPHIRAKLLSIYIYI